MLGPANSIKLILNLHNLIQNHITVILRIVNKVNQNNISFHNKEINQEQLSNPEH